ncbi:MAG: YegS/Rv2252/BmrU family lipid kinase [Lachnospiraceae bacterium]|nr:YegS/Rv2252/BmrU family lipid kinase [Lachnospiraceae bacterium]
MQKFDLLVYNPHAGQGKFVLKLRQVIDILSANENELIVHPTTAPLDAWHVVEKLAKGDCLSSVTCAGGDGMLNEVINGVINSGKDIPISYIPTGTTNDFGYTLKISKDIIKATKTAVLGVPFISDAGKFNNRYFTYTAAFGLFSDVSYGTSQKLKNAFGHAAYILQGISKLTQIKTIHCDGVITDAEGKEETFGGEFLYGMILNSDSVGGFRKFMGNNVKIDDGVFEMLLIRRPKNLVELDLIIADLTAKKFTNSNIFCRKIKKVLFESKEEIPWALDGEFAGAFKSSRISVVPGAVTYVVPEKKINS